jgi:hypothetical protein
VCSWPEEIVTDGRKDGGMEYAYEQTKTLTVYILN